MAKLLTVDDSFTMRRLINLTASSIGFDVCEASSGEECLQAIETQTFDAILLDINMDGISGIDTLEQIRKNPKHDKTVILMLTTESTQAVKDRAKSLGATGWITKPFSQLQLQAVLEKVIK